METSFCELRGKEVINIIDGKRLGKIIDIVFDVNCNRVLGFVVPSQNKSWNIFKSSEDIFIPVQDICKIGEDVILVKVFLPNVNIQKVKSSKYQKDVAAQNQTTENDVIVPEKNYAEMFDLDKNNENLQNIKENKTQ